MLTRCTPAGWEGRACRGCLALPCRLPCPAPNRSLACGCDARHCLAHAPLPHSLSPARSQRAHQGRRRRQAGPGGCRGAAAAAAAGGQGAGAGHCRCRPPCLRWAGMWPACACPAAAAPRQRTPGCLHCTDRLSSVSASAPLCAAQTASARASSRCTVPTSWRRWGRRWRCCSLRARRRPSRRATCSTRSCAWTRSSTAWSTAGARGCARWVRWGAFLDTGVEQLWLGAKA